MNIPRHVLIRRVLLAAFFGVPVAFVWLGGGDWLSLEMFQSNRERLLNFTQSHFWPFFLLWGLLYATAVAFSLPGASLFSLVTGFLFGRWLGTVLIAVSASSGAVVVFTVARYLFADAARRRLEASPAAAKILAGFERDAAGYLLFMRLVPVFPFWLVNLAAAISPVGLRTYLWTTAVGIVPGGFVFANLGRSLGEVQSLQGLLSAPVVTAFVLLGLLALVPVLLRIFGRRRDTAEPGEGA
jgi:uncharacterized membrane protein YdjX (TVP38/TMEM64 family)